MKRRKILLALGCVAVLAIAGPAQGTPVLLPNGTLSFEALYLIPTAPLKPDNVTYSVEGCYDSAPQLNVYFGALEIPQQMDRADSVPGPKQAYGVHTWSTKSRHTNASQDLYLLNDNLYWNLEDGTITVVDPVLLLDAAPGIGADSSTYVADYDATTIAVITPAMFPLKDLNTAAAAAVDGPVIQSYQSVTKYSPQEAGRPPIDTTYRNYLQRLAYFIETLALTDNSQCAGTQQGYPQLAALGDYTLAAVLSEAMEEFAASGPLLGDGDDDFIDGQNVAVRFLTSNDTQAAAVCLATPDPSHAYSIKGSIIQEPVVVEDAGACCEACTQQHQAALNSPDLSESQCNFWLFCSTEESCLFPNGNGTLEHRQCALGYAPQLAMNEMWGRPVEFPHVGKVLIELAWPITGLTLPQRADNDTMGYGLDVPVTVDPLAEDNDTSTGGLQWG